MVCAAVAACSTPQQSTKFLGAGAAAYTHALSGLTFPAEAAGFRRTDVIEASETQLLVSYELPPREAPTVVTIALFRAPPNGSAGCMDEFRDRKRATERVNAGLTWVDEGDVALTLAGAAYPGRMAAFDVVDGGLKTRGQIFAYCPVLADWLLSYRVSAPLSAAAQPVAAFMAQVPAAPAPR